jgi:hypothetical protein
MEFSFDPAGHTTWSHEKDVVSISQRRADLKLLVIIYRLRPIHLAILVDKDFLGLSFDDILSFASFKNFSYFVHGPFLLSMNYPPTARPGGEGLSVKAGDVTSR